MLPGDLAAAAGTPSNLVGDACEIHNCLSIVLNPTDARSVVLALADADPLGVRTNVTKWVDWIVCAFHRCTIGLCLMLRADIIL
jgi:hypothetical protein